MTIDEVIAICTKSKTKWSGVTNYGSGIHTFINDGWGIRTLINGYYFCPITYACFENTGIACVVGAWETAAGLLGLEIEDARLLERAADGAPGELRDKLVKALHDQHPTNSQVP